VSSTTSVHHYEVSSPESAPQSLFVRRQTADAVLYPPDCGVSSHVAPLLLQATVSSPTCVSEFSWIPDAGALFPVTEFFPEGALSFPVGICGNSGLWSLLFVKTIV
jgi:hypothetical protein